MKSKEWDKTSKNYYNEVLSPLKNAKTNPLFEDIKKLKNKSSVIDLGCGLGALEPFLSKQFKKITAIDFSKEMIQKAQRKNKSLKNITFKQQNMLNPSSFENKFNTAIAINSIIDPNSKKINKILKQINTLLKTEGTFIAILPSMEVYAYLALLINESSNPEKAKKIINKKQHDFVLGTTNFEGKQKAFYEFEIKHRLEKAKFRNIQIKKVLYPWKEFKAAGQPAFPNENPPWDWYVICKK